MNKLAKLLLASTIISTLVLVRVAQIYAQEASTVPSEEVISRPSNAALLTEKQLQYRQALEQYRTLERQYLIDTEQYRQLGTLSALETAVRTTKATNLARNEVLSIYLQMLQLQLSDATGIEVSLKEQYQAELEARLTELETFRVKVEQSDDRTSLESIRADFAAISPSVEATAYQVQTLLAVGKLQTVWDQASSVRIAVNDIIEQQSDDVAKPARRRAITETEAALTSVRAELQSIVTKLGSNDDRQFTRSNFSQYSRELSSVYAGLNQSLGFLYELAVEMSL